MKFGAVFNLTENGSYLIVSCYYFCLNISDVTSVTAESNAKTWIRFVSRKRDITGLTALYRSF